MDYKERLDKLMFKEVSGGRYDFAQPKLKYGSKEWNALSKAYEADANPKYFRAALGGTYEKKGNNIFFDGKKGYYQKLRNGAEYIVDENGRTIANYDGYKRNGFEKKFGKPKKHKSSESYKSKLDRLQETWKGIVRIKNKNGKVVYTSVKNFNTPNGAIEDAKMAKRALQIKDNTKDYFPDTEA